MPQVLTQHHAPGTFLEDATHTQATGGSRMAAKKKSIQPKKRARKKVVTTTKNKSIDLTKEVLDTLRLKAEQEQISEQYQDARQDLLKKLQDSGRKSITVEDEDGNRHKATVVTGTSIHVVEDRLKKSLGAKLWNKVTRQKLDDKLLEDAIATGDIDPVVVAECTVEKDRAPYVRVT